MESAFSLIEERHIHALIQQSRFHEAAKLLECLIYNYRADSDLVGLRLIVASMQPNVEDYLRWEAIIQKSFPGTGQDWLACGLHPGVDIHQSIIYLQRARKKMNKDPYVHYFLARAWLMLGKTEKALRCANTCYALDVQFHRVLLVRMECYRRMGLRELQVKDGFSLMCLSAGMNKEFLWKSLQRY